MLQMPASIAGLADGAHVVQFYSDDAVLIDFVARLVGTALIAGDSAVVLATRAHDDALRERLLERGFDVSVPIAQGRYLPVDASEVLRQIHHRGRLDTAACQALAIDVIARARLASESDPPRVVVFGEAVDLLMRSGYPASAIELERVWNELMTRERFALCCAYDMQAFRGGQPAAPFLHVCGQHSQVFPAERRSARRVTRATAG